MGEETSRRNTWRLITVLMLLIATMGLSGVAMAGLPASVPAGVPAGVPAPLSQQAKGQGQTESKDQGQQDQGTSQKQSEATTLADSAIEAYPDSAADTNVGPKPFPGSQPSAPPQSPPSVKLLPPAPLAPPKTPLATCISNGSGNWNNPATWSCGFVPTAADDVIIANGHTITIDTAAVALNLTVGQGTSGVLQYDPATAQSLTVGGNVTVAAGGTFQANPAGAVVTHALSIGGSLINTGAIDFSQNADTSQVAITFTGAGSANWSGSGATNLKSATGVTVDKGTSNASTLTFTPGAGAFTVQGGSALGFLAISNGTFEIGGSSAFSNPVFAAAAFTIPATGAFRLNDSNASIFGQAGSPTNNGLFRLSDGTWNIGTVGTNVLGAGTGAMFTFEGGTLNLAGRMATANAVTVNLSGGVINVCMAGTCSTTPSYGFTSASTISNYSGGTINLVQNNGLATADYNVAGTMNFTGGTLNIGTAATAGTFTFRAQGQLPHLVIDNTTNAKTLNLTGQTNVWGNLTINTGTTLNTNPGTAQALVQIGPTLINNGAIVNTSSNTGIVAFAGNLGTSPAQTYAGTGTFGSVTNPIGTLQLQNAGGLTITPGVSTLYTLRINALFGAITGANNITLGIGGASTGIVQRGNGTTNGFALPAGTLDVSPTFNVGTGGLNVIYAPANSNISTGPEIPATRTVNLISISNEFGVTLAGGPLTATATSGALTLVSGVLTTSAVNLLTLTATNTTAVSGGNAASYVNGPLERTLPASLAVGSTYTFPVGKGSLKMLELVNPTTSAGGTVVVRGEVFDASSGGSAGTGLDGIRNDRYWSTQFVSGAANFITSTVRLTEPSISGVNSIGYSATQGGSYDSIGGAVSGATIASVAGTPVTGAGFFTVGTLTGQGPANIAGGTYTVGAAGTYTTLTAAIAAINGRALSGPVTLSLIDGVYAGETYPITLTGIGTSAANTLTIKPSVGPANSTPSFTGSSASALIILNGAKYVVIDGSNTAGGSSRDLTFTNTNTGTSSAVVWGQSIGTAASASNNTIKNLNLVGNAVSTTVAGVGFGSTTISTSSLGTANNNNTFQNNFVTTTQIGIYSQGASSSIKNLGNVITGNLVGSTGGGSVGRVGIDVGFQDGIQITGNNVASVVAATFASGGSYGINLGGSIGGNSLAPAGNEVSNSSVTGNYIGTVQQPSTTGWSSIGMLVVGATVGTNVIANNSIYGVLNGTTPSDVTIGIFVVGVNAFGVNTQIYFNSVSMTGFRDAISTPATMPSYALAIAGTNPIVDVRNNSLYNTQTAANTTAASSYAIGLASALPLSNLTINYNDLYTSGANGKLTRFGSLAASAGTDSTTLAAWQANTGKDLNSISADPMYTSATDLQPLSGSQLFGAGQAIAGITTDILGFVRGNPPTIGAYEYTAGGPPTATSTSTSTSTNTPVPATNTSTNTATNTQVPATNTATNTVNVPTATATCQIPQNYNTSLSTGATIVPGTTDTGNHADDVLTSITLPFPYQLYDTVYTSAQVASNGALFFGTANATFNITCIPNALGTYVIAPYWGDQCTGPCFNTPCTGCGIFTSVSGSSPNQIFNIEYRTNYYGQTGQTQSLLDYEIRLYQGQTRYDVIYGPMVAATVANDSQLTVGVQKNPTSYTVIGACDTTGGQSPPVSTGQMYVYTLGACTSSTPTLSVTPTNSPASTATSTATQTNTAVPTNTQTSTPTNTAGAATATPTCSANGTIGAWTVGNPLPASLESPNADGDSTNAYSAGGYDGVAGSVSSLFARYNPATNTWTSLTAMSPAADGVGTVYSPINNKIYVFGGADNPGNGLSTTRIYDIAGGTWSTGAAMPAARNRFAGKGYYNGKIYLVGGSTDISYANAQATTWEYDPVANTWNTSRANMPVALLTGGSGVVNGHLYVIGGANSGGTAVATVYDYDIAANTWTTRTSVPTAVAQPGTGVIGSQIVIFGGGTPFLGDGKTLSAREHTASRVPNAVNTTRIFETSGYTWSVGPNLNVARSLQAGARAGNYLVSIAGYDGSTSDVNTTELSFITIVPCATATNTPVGATNTSTSTNTPVGATATPTACVAGYTIATATGTIVPGTTDTSNHGDDVTTTINLPFAMSFYGNSYNTAIVGSNGTLGFVANGNAFTNACLPAAAENYAILPYWDDQRTDTGLSGCTAWANGCGIFTTQVGSTFYIDYHTVLFADNSVPLEYEIILTQGSSSFSVVYGTGITDTGSETIGVQKDTGSVFTQYKCNTASPAITGGLQLNFIAGSCGPTNTPAATNTPAPLTSTPTGTNTPSGATATATPCVPAVWTIKAPFGAGPVVRGLGVWYPNNSKFYVLGGRSTDVAGSDYLNPHEYDPVADTWITKTAVFTDAQVNNIVGGVMTVPGFANPVIVMVGGSAAGAATSSNAVRVYDPIADTITTLGDNWPQAPTASTLPGGGAIYQNKLYILGGFNINVSMINTIWVFDPSQPAGSRWTLKSATLPVAMGYIPATTVGSMIYIGGGSLYTTTIVDSNNSYAYNPVADTITTIATIPRATGETRAVTIGGQMWVLGGGRTAPNPSTEVDIYDPGTDTWSLGLPMASAARNAAADTDGSRVFVAGGYGTAGTPTNITQVYAGGGCASATPTAVGPSPTPCSVGGIPGPWATSTTGPSARYRNTGISDGTYVYVMGGGTSSGTYLNDLWRWDPTGQTWTQLANMPTAKQNAQAAYWNGKIYLPGGYIGTHITENAIYDIASNTWSTGAPLPAARSGMSAAYNGKIYVVGGNPVPFNDIIVYDIATDSWSTAGATLPVGLAYGRAITVGSYIYVIGGIAGGTTVGTVYRYDPVADVVTTMAPLQQARTWEELMSDGTSIFAVAGGGPGTSYFNGVPLANTVEIYDIATDSWTYGNPVVTTASSVGGGSAGGKLMIQGGVDGVSYYDLVQVSTLQGGGGCTPVPTNTPGGPTNTPLPSATPTTCVANYTLTTSTGATIVPGTTMVSGSNCDDCVNPAAIPFPFTFYGNSYSSVNVDSNGTLQFVSSTSTFTNACEPYASHNYVIHAYWDDLLLTTAGDGIYTSVSGSAPNRIFNVEWRGCYYSGGVCGTRVSFEARLYEGTGQIDVIYATVGNGNSSATGGVQKDTGSLFLQAFCNGSGQPVSAGSMFTYMPGSCATGTPATATPTNTPGGATATPTCVAGGVWTPGAALPGARLRYGFAQNGNDLYVIGGLDATFASTTANSRYNAATNTWTTLAPVPASSEANSCAYLSGFIYCTQGFDGPGFYIYNVGTDTWTTGPSVPGVTDTYGSAVGASGTNVYVVGGGSGGASTSVEVYSTTGNTWSSGTAAPSPYLLGGYTSVGQYLYAIGSYGATPLTKGTNPNTNPNLPASSIKNARQDKVEAPDANSTASLRLDMSSGTWTSGPTWTQGRADMALAYDPAGGKLYAIGGDAQNGTYFDFTNAVDEYSVSAWPGGSFTASAPLLPTGRQANQAGFYSTGRAGGEIWSTGGYNGGALAEHLYRGTGGCGATATPTPVGPSPTPTCIAGGASWGAGPDFNDPLGNIRGLGVYFPPTGKFYVIGGRDSDSAGSDSINPHIYDPVANSWSTASSTVVPDNQVNNMGGGVVTVSGTPMIVVVGGSAAGATTGTSAVRYYNPSTDTWTDISSTDAWPAPTDTLPGGYAVVNNKLYILGGFTINIGMTQEVWEFDPNGTAGSRWTLKGSTLLPQPLGYIPTAAIGGMIYTAGGSGWDGTTIFDTDYSYKYDPTTNTLTTITSIPRLTAETRALTMGGEMWVMGGGRDAPNPSNEVDVYDPGTDSWSVGTPFVTARRNFAVDTDGGGTIWLVGGYAPSTATANMEIYTSGGGCVTPTETPTTPPSTNTPTDTPVAPSATNTQVPGTATDTPVVPPTDTDTPVVPPTDTDTPIVPPTDTAVVPPTDTAVVPPTATDTAVVPTATATATACPVDFTDVHPTDWFYEYVQWMYCHGVVNGYSTSPPCDTGTPCFKPGNPTTRGQLAKIVVLAFNFTIDTTGGPHFQDVPIGHTFYVHVETAYNLGLIVGYPCGGPGEPCGAGSKPYYRPASYVTRGQITKIVVGAAVLADPSNWTLENPPTNTFEDVAVGSTFYQYIETAYSHGVIEGYPCGTPPAGPCVAPGNKPYFLPNADATRAQISKIAYLSVLYTPSAAKPNN